MNDGLLSIILTKKFNIEQNKEPYVESRGKQLSFFNLNVMNRNYDDRNTAHLKKFIYT